MRRLCRTLANANPVGLGLALRSESVDWRLENVENTMKIRWKLLEKAERWRKMVKQCET